MPKLITQGDILRTHREALGLTIEEAVALEHLAAELPNPVGMTDAEMLYIYETDQQKLNAIAIDAIVKALRGAPTTGADGVVIAGKALDTGRLVAAAETDEGRVLKVAGLSGLKRSVAVRLSGLLDDLSEEEMGALLEFLITRPLSVESKIEAATDGSQGYAAGEKKKGRKPRDVPPEGQPS